MEIWAIFSLNYVINIPETVRRQLRGKPDWLGLGTVLSFSSGPSNYNSSLTEEIINR